MYYRVKTKSGKKNSIYIVEDIVIEGVSTTLAANGVTDIVRSISETKYATFMDLSQSEEDNAYFYEVRVKEVGENGKTKTRLYLMEACDIEDIKKKVESESMGDIKGIIKTDIKSIFQKKK